MSETVAFVCSHVFHRTRPVLLVSRVDGDWQFLCGDERPDEKPHVVGLNHLFDNDPSLDELKALPPEWEAEREAQLAPWRRSSPTD